MNIVLNFNKKNNFCQVCTKHGVNGDRIEIARNTLWVINCARTAIERDYKIGSPRQVEMEALYNDLINQLKKQLTADECEELKIGIEPLVLGILG